MSEMLEQMRAARGTAAELKLKLISLRAEIPNDYILVFEGDDDRAVYFSWMRYLDAEFKYEPFTCSGKKGVLKLKGAVERDAGDIGRRVMFFVDNDFDGAADVSIDGSIYVTEGYSVENHLVNADVLEEILKIEFHCHQAPASRRRVLQAFEEAYASFLEMSCDVNFEIFVARKNDIALEENLPSSIHSFIEIDLRSASRRPVEAKDVVRPVRPINAEERELARIAFQALCPALQYRGKFALSFFMKWLEKLAAERREQRSDLFEGLSGDVRVIHGRLSLATLASRSRPPASLSVFVEAARRTGCGHAEA